MCFRVIILVKLSGIPSLLKFLACALKDFKMHQSNLATLCIYSQTPLNACRRESRILPEVWGIVRCGLKVAKPKWCEEDEYVEIQKTTKPRSIVNPPEFITSLLKNVHFMFIIVILTYEYSVSQISMKMCNYRSLSWL